MSHNFYKAVEKGYQGFNKGILTNIPKLDKYIHGIQKGTYYLIGAETSVGKTKFARDLFVYNLLDQNVFIIDFALEMPENQLLSFLVSRSIYEKHGVYLSTADIFSWTTPISQEHLKLVLEDKTIEKYKEKSYLYKGDLTTDEFEKTLFSVAKEIGELKGTIDEITSYKTDKHVIVLIDTINLVTPQRQSIKEAIDRLSRVATIYRNICNFTFVVIQQFSAEISSTDRSRYGVVTPLLRDFEDSKRPTKDCDIALGLFDPARHQLEFFNGYDIQSYKGAFRSLHIMKSRYGVSQKFIPLIFDGKIGTFKQCH